LAATVLASAGTLACSRSDATVQSNLQQQLAADPGTARAHLTVTVNEGVATIKGETESVAQQQRVVDIASAVKGLLGVQSEMRLTDAALTDEVKKAIAADALVKEVPLRIEVQNAEVKLYSDRTNGDQRARLKELAEGVPGVVHVEDKMK
jgi:osmotically-inducible protein OsmY